MHATKSEGGLSGVPPERRDQPPAFIDIATFGKEADACAKHLAKGREIAVTGRLVYQQWETETGEKRSKHEAIGQVQFGSGGNHVPPGRTGADA
ncbi:MAG TPA: single-stranded DNA-binding protein [Solirubrobacteraceae bacterium]|nr:single-stranded DNA-binding protein [Solirubrobacteraceae bacterium]HME01404.1 single-stranded DNA-binding protein [Solirubrobacteraceae bacterium]